MESGFQIWFSEEDFQMARPVTHWFSMRFHIVSMFN